MRVNDDLAVVPLQTSLMGGPTTLNLALILDPEHGHTLVDAGVPGQLGDLQAALSEVGVSIGEVRRVILTHADLDHVGSLADLVREGRRRGVRARGRGALYRGPASARPGRGRPCRRRCANSSKRGPSPSP